MLFKSFGARQSSCLLCIAVNLSLGCLGAFEFIELAGFSHLFDFFCLFNFDFELRNKF